jgi:hypothetical protein
LVWERNNTVMFGSGKVRSCTAWDRQSLAHRSIGKVRFIRITLSFVEQWYRYASQLFDMEWISTDPLCLGITNLGYLRLLIGDDR